MNSKLIFFIILIGLIIYSPEINAQTAKIQTIVLDPGHGGTDPGAVGKKAKEKDITLAVTKKVGEYIKKEFPDINIIYTRTTDVAVRVQDRPVFANKNNADLFISIHCNSVGGSPNTHGAETYILGESRNKENLEVAKRENAAILYESNVDESYKGFDPNSTESYIAFSFMQSEFKHQSFELADLVQKELIGKTQRSDRGVQQACFWVLYNTAMPAILIELDFITNPAAETYMMSKTGQDEMARAIANAFSTYKKKYESNSSECKKTPEVQAKTEVDKNSGVVYKVQFTTRNRPVDNPASVYKKLKDVDYYEHNGVYKYTAGCFATKAEADKYLKEVKALGYDGAFVVKFEDGVRK